MQNRSVLTLTLKSGTALLCLALIGLGLPSLSLAACIDYQAQVNQAVRAQDLDRLEPLLATLKTQIDCSTNYLDGLTRSMAQIAAARADRLTQLGQLDEAEEWLKRAPTLVWATQVVHGYIATRRKQWQAAARYYNQALNLIANEEVTPRAPELSVIRKVYKMASQAQVLAGNLDNTVSRSGKASGTMLCNLRGFQPTRRLIPINFATGVESLSETGKKAARQLARYLKRQSFKEITLIGHTDTNGSYEYNDILSQKRAEAVKGYLRQAGVGAKIHTDGKGEMEPLQVDSSANYTHTEIDTLNRRVEFVAKCSL